MAKKNVEYYSAIGLLCDLESTFKLLEEKLPLFFKGSLDIFIKLNEEPPVRHTKRKIIFLRLPDASYLSIGTLYYFTNQTHLKNVYYISCSNSK
jgi:hypothetical protein